MKYIPRRVRIPISIAIIFGSQTGIAQQVVPYALPHPPASILTALDDSASLRYDRSAGDAANASRRQLLLDRIAALSQDVRKLALEEKARLGGQVEHTPHSSAEASSQPDATRAQRARELASWKRFLSTFDLESICGLLDNSQEVEKYDGTSGPSKAFVSAHEPAVAQIQWLTNVASRIGPGAEPGNIEGQRWCSGTLISAKRFLTAGHCFDASDDAEGWITPKLNAKSLSPARLAPLMQVVFNYQVDVASGVIRTGIAYPIVRLVEHRLGKLDYAIVELGANTNGDPPSKTFLPTPVAKSKSALDAAKLLTVIQHPNGNPKRVAAGVGIGVNLPTVTYSDIDTLGGSSGSGVLDQDGKVIAVHTNGGCYENGGSNSGVTLFSISKVSAVLK